MTKKEFLEKLEEKIKTIGETITDNTYVHLVMHLDGAFSSGDIVVFTPENGFWYDELKNRVIIGTLDDHFRNYNVHTMCYRKLINMLKDQSIPDNTPVVFNYTIGCLDDEWFGSVLKDSQKSNNHIHHAFICSVDEYDELVISDVNILDAVNIGFNCRHFTFEEYRNSVFNKNNKEYYKYE